MLAPNNFLSPATGEPILTPSQDMVLGCFYLTANNPSQQTSKDYYFVNFDDVTLAYQQGKILLHTFVWVKYDGYVEQTNFEYKETKLDNIHVSISPYTQVKKTIEGEILSTYIRTTPGRILLNESFK